MLSVSDGKVLERTLTASSWPTEVPFNKTQHAVFTGRCVNYDEAQNVSSEASSSVLVLDHCLDFKTLGLYWSEEFYIHFSPVLEV